MLNEALVQRLYERANAARWSLPVAAFAAALEASAAGKAIGGREVERYLASLHLEDLALACACAAGNEGAWELFIREQRLHLYRAADALDPGGGARELADSLYAELYGLRDSHGERRSLFHYFHGRSSLATWLRAVLSQRHVDRIRTSRRFEPLPDEDAAPPAAAASQGTDPDRARCLALMHQGLSRAMARLPARDRLRLGCYYAQELTLAETGRVLGEHEATVSRQLARTRKALRADVEQYLCTDAGMREDEVARCFQSTAEDAGPLDLDEMLGDAPERKSPARHRSIGGESL